MRMWYALSLVIAIALPLTTGIRPAIAVVLYPWCVQYGGIASSTMNCGSPPPAMARGASQTRSTRRIRPRHVTPRRCGANAAAGAEPAEPLAS